MAVPPVTLQAADAAAAQSLLCEGAPLSREGRAWWERRAARRGSPPRREIAAQTVCGLAIGGGGKVGADPGGQPCQCARPGQQRPVQRAQRGVNPVEVALRQEETVGQADLVDGEPDVALQVQGLSVYLKVAVRAGHSLAAHVDSGHPFSKEAARSADDGGWTAATEVEQEMFSHFALIMELANSFWPRKLSAAPIGFSFQCETLFKALVEHFIPRLQVVDEKEAVRSPARTTGQAAPSAAGG